ncbi:MAG TPA: VOC family protein [Chromatiales bacterium]|nr:VOC family protein [Chromatiales bacterium]
MSVQPVPEGYHTITPSLSVKGAVQMIEFLKQAFDAAQKDFLLRPDGAVGHATLRIGDSMIMLGETMEGWQPMPLSLYLYVDDVDATYRRALQAGASSVMEPADMFWGDRHGAVKDQWGNVWLLATHTEDVPEAEIARRAKAFFAQQPAAG